MDGIPITGDEWLLKNILRKEWKFRGFVVSDLYSVDGIWSDHHVVGSRDEAGIVALKAGVDADLGAQGYSNLEKSLKEGKITMNDIDMAVRRILRLKFEMGLFENPYINENLVSEVRSEEHKKVALEVARASITLLKNNGILPLNNDQKIVVIGPNANNTYNLLGDYTAPQDDGNVKTILFGIQQKTKNVEYVKGCSIRDMNNSNIEEAVKVGLKSDIIVVAVGGSSARDFRTSYQDTGAADIDNNFVSDMDCGEGFDRATLDLLGRQMELLEKLKKTGKPLVVIYIEGRPLNKNWAAENADALITAYYPGQEGGIAIADVLFGDYNPAGRFPVSVPRYVGQIPVYYNQKYPHYREYMDMTSRPLYVFGYGLSYTTFKYENLSISKKDNEKIIISFDITNTGKRDGEEVP
jgi:beta-glucosidase